MKEIVKNERKIKISIDASRSIDSIQKTGVEKVSDELLTELKTQLAKHKEIEPVFYTPKQISWLPKESQRILRWPPKLLWTQIRLSWELVWRRPNIFFAPVHALPWVLLLCHPVLDTGSRKTDLDSGSEAGMTNKKIRVYKILHDIAFKRNPGFYSWQQKLILNFDLWMASLVCAKIFVPTQAVKDDILKYFPKINTEKIVVIHHGYNPVCHSEAESRRIPALPAGRPSQSKNTEGSFANAQDDKKIKKQILYIGRVEEKKNISNLIKAFEIFSQKKSDYKLILAGKIDSNFITSYGLQVTGYKNIEFLGYITEQKKQELLQESSCLVLISQAEGFGFTILEGFDFGLPVLASDIPVLKEIGGDACLFVNPENPEKIAAGLEKITSDESLRQNLRERGREQLKKFSWQIAAEKYLSVLSQNE